MTLLRLEKAHIRLISLMLTRAFKDDQAEIFPDPIERKVKAPYVHELFLRCSFPYVEGLVISPRLEGVVVWRRSDINTGVFWWRIITSSASQLALKIGLRAQRKILAFHQYMDKKRKELVPTKHFYLNMLAVDPKYQGKGYASKLLNAMLSETEKEGLPCYLETGGDKNVSIYKHFGFKVIGEYTIPGVKDRFIAMLRVPKK
ncbi:MAG: GNAT family N-acetyltransferase [Dehalococcoidia bacterium]|nr:MAG: GNAT family N-acetyltransferase [Dehalococcoidia bacterium]